MTPQDVASIQSRGEQQAAVAIAFLVLSWLLIALRIWTRTYIISNFGWDDFAMILAGMIFTVYCAAMLYLHAHGAGTTITGIDDLIRLTKWAIVAESTYLLTIMILKISLGIFFARIIVRRWQLVTIQITVAINVISSTASFFFVLLRCGPNIDNYVYRQLQRKCTPLPLNRFFAYQSAAVTTLTDCIFAFLPIFILWHASMDLRSKISVGLILSLALLGCVCSMIRFQYIDGLLHIENFFWNAVNIAIWSTIEPGTGIVAGCLATLRPLLKRFFVTAQSMRSSASQTTKGISRSIRSKNTQSQKSPGQSYTRDSVADTQNFELKSDTSRTTEDTEAIMPRDEAGMSHFSWDQRNSRSSVSSQTRRNVPVTRSRALSESSNRPLPPLPDDAV